MWRREEQAVAKHWDIYVWRRTYSDFLHAGYLEQQKTVLIVFACLLLCVSLVCALAQSAFITLAVFGVIGAAILAVIWPHVGLLLLYACAGLPALILPLPGYHMHLVEPVTALCFIVVIVRRPPARLFVPHLLALAFLILALISFIHVPEVASGAQGNNIYGADKRLLALCIVLGTFFCSTLLGIYIKDRARFLIGILFVSLPPYLIGLAELIGVPLAPWLEASGANNLKMTLGRLWGPFPWSVNFGMYLINLFAVAIVCWLQGKRRWQRTFGGTMTLVTALSIIGTGTRSVAIAASMITLIAFGVTRRFKLLISTLLLAIALYAPFSDKIGTFFTHDEASTTNRLLIWNLALKLIQTHPWLGIGLEQFHYYYAQLIVSPADELGAQGIHPHQQYLEWAMESGLLWLIIGILLLLSIIFCCTRSYYSIQHNLQKTLQEYNQYDLHGQQMIVLAAGLAMIANILIGFFDAPLDQLEGPVLLFSLAGLALGQAFPGSWPGSPPVCSNDATASNNGALEPQQQYKNAIHLSYYMARNKSARTASIVLLLWHSLFDGRPRSDNGLSLLPWLGSTGGSTMTPKGGTATTRDCRYAASRQIKCNGLLSMIKYILEDLPFNKKIAATTTKENQAGARLDSTSTGRTIAIQLLSWGIAIPLILPTTALLAHYLGPVQYGEYSLTFPFLTIFALLSGTGMDPLIIRQLSNEPRTAWSRILSYALGSRLISTLISTAVAVLVACLLPVQAEQRNLFLLGSISLLFSFSFNGVRIVLSHGFRAEQRVALLATLEAANRILTAGLVALVVMLHLSLLWIYIIVVYSDLPAFLLQAWLAYRRYNIRLRFSLSHLHEYTLNGLPLVGHRVLSLVAGQIDLLILTIESTPLNVGIYALASRITDPLISLANVYVNGLYPLLCTSFCEDKKQFAVLYTEAVRGLLLITLPGAIMVTMGASSIVEVLGGEQFRAATGVVQILMWAMILTFLNQLAESACTAAHLERRVPLVTTTSTIINLAVNLLLIPRWQIIGASIAMLSSEGMALCLFTILLKKYIPPLPMIGATLSIFVCNLPALALLRWQSSKPFTLTMPLSIVLSIMSYIATGTLMREDLVKLWQIGHINSELQRRS